MNMESMFPLQHNKDFLSSSSFQGYKLSLETLPMISNSPSFTIKTKSPAETQNGLAHVKLFAAYSNVLLSSPIGPLLLNGNGDIYSLDVIKLDFTLLWKNKIKILSSLYPPSLVFIDDNLIVYSCGSGTLEFLECINSQKWTSLFSFNILEDNQSFVIRDAKKCRKDENDKNSFEILLSYIRDDEDEALEYQRSKNVMEWLHLHNWTLKKVRRFEFDGSIEFVKFTKDSFYVLSDECFHCIWDSELGNIPKDEMTEGHIVYYQNDDKILIWISKPFVRPVLNSSQQITLGRRNLDLSHPIDSISWRIDDGSIRIECVKGIKNERFHIANVEEIFEERNDSETDNGKSFTNENEEIDDEDSRNLVLSLVNSKKFDCSDYSFLCTSPRGFLLRKDVDGLHWSLENEEFVNDDGYSALGYIVASKTSRKFTLLSSNYFAIVDAYRHVYIYRKPIQLSTELRNRRSGAFIKSLAQQHVQTLPSAHEEILGALSLNSQILLVTKNTVYLIKIE